MVASFRDKHVVVVGDVMLDEYMRGEVSRVSPEAPVPIVDLTERRFMPGGAANAVANVVSLGGKATLVGVVGGDAQADQLRAAMIAGGVGVDGLVASLQRPTTHKLRIVARTQQIVRVDVESRHPLERECEALVIARVEALASSAHALVISDYAKGVVTLAVIRECLEASRRHGIPLIVDPKSRDFTRYAGATILTPNVLEFEVATGKSTRNESVAIVAAGNDLLSSLNGASVLVTRGAAGMTLLSSGRAPLHLPTVARSVFDVTGAGDTVVGALSLALAAKTEMYEALVVATHAASIAVSRAGTVAVTSEELCASLRS